MSFKSKIFVQLAFLTLFFVIGSILLELCYRGILFAAGKQQIYQSDDLLGWSPRPNITLQRKMKTFKGNTYQAFYTTDQFGFRHSDNDWPATKSKHEGELPILLVIGDSYTADFYTSDSEHWVSVLDQNLPFSVYAYGMGGSGSYQQLLAFQKLIRSIKPEVLLIQVCSNDPGDDSFATSSQSIVLNQTLRRPYLLNGKKYWPTGFIPKIYNFAYNSSFLFRRFDIAVQSLRYNQNNGYYSPPLSSRQIKDDLKNWKLIYQQFVDSARSSDVQEVWSVSCSTSKSAPQFHSTWIKASEESNVIAFEGFSSAVESALTQDLDVLYSDGGHWNSLGNKIAGEALTADVQSYLSRDQP